jgi:hypothetical protein
MPTFACLAILPLLAHDKDSTTVFPRLSLSEVKASELTTLSRSPLIGRIMLSQLLQGESRTHNTGTLKTGNLY